MVDCLGRKLRGLVKVQPFAGEGGEGPPQFAKERVQVEAADDLLPLITGTKKLYMTGAPAGDEEIICRERTLVAQWLQRKLQPQFETPIEVTSASASHHGKVLARFAGSEEPSKSWQRFYSTFHIDHKQNTASMEEGVQVNVWLNLSEQPISDFNLGFLQRAGCIMAGGELPLLTQEDLEEVTIRYQAELTKDQALIFQSTGAQSVVHGCFRFQDVDQLTHAPRYSLEFRLLLRQLRVSLPEPCRGHNGHNGHNHS